MVRSHPHQNVYFNSLVGGLRNAKGNFEIGYWGPEFREGLEYILKNDSRENIDTYASWEPVWFNAEILTPPERERIRYVGKKNQADYFLSNYHRHPDEYEFDEVWSRKINGVKIMTVYGLKYGK